MPDSIDSSTNRDEDNVVDTYIDFDFVLKYIGDLGKYQIAMVLMAYWVCIPAGMTQVAAVFLAAIPEHRCKIPAYDDHPEDFVNITEAQVVNMTIPYDDETDVSLVKN